MSDSCEVFKASIIQGSSKAVLVRFHVGAEEKWVPNSVIHDDSEIWKAGETGYIKVLTWWAEKNGLLK